MGGQPTWTMSQQGKDYFADTYKDHTMKRILVGGEPLLNEKQFVPYHQNHDLTQAEKDERYITTAGYTYPGEEELYLRDLDDAGYQPTLADADAFMENRKKRNALTAEKKAMLDAIALERLTNAADEKSFGISKVGTHEAIHSNIFDEKLGAYPNAIAAMLRGTSALGVPQGKDKYLGKRLYGPPNKRYLEHSPYTSRYEQDELYTQWLTGKLTHGEGSYSPIKADFPYSLYRDMDRPVVGPLGQEGIENLLEKTATPFLKQLHADAEAGYVQPSIWSQ